MKFLPKLFENNRVQAVREAEVVKHAWRQDQPVMVHGWIYDLKEGLLRDLDLN